MHPDCIGIGVSLSALVLGTAYRTTSRDSKKGPEEAKAEPAHEDDSSEATERAEPELVVDLQVPLFSLSFCHFLCNPFGYLCGSC